MTPSSPRPPAITDTLLGPIPNLVQLHTQRAAHAGAHGGARRLHRLRNPRRLAPLPVVVEDGTRPRVVRVGARRLVGARPDVSMRVAPAVVQAPAAKVARRVATARTHERRAALEVVVRLAAALARALEREDLVDNMPLQCVRLAAVAVILKLGEPLRGGRGGREKARDESARCAPGVGGAQHVANVR
eukprot:4277146-Prymnesium_polylepis.2